MVSLESLAEQFDELGVEPAPAILGKCLDLCTTYNISDPVEFVEQWMAFSVSHLNGAEPTLDNLNDLERKELSAQLKRDKHATTMGNVSAKGLSAIGGRGPAFECASPKAKVFGGHFAGAATGDAGDDLMDSYISRTPTASSSKRRCLAVDSPSSGASPLLSNNTSSYTSGQVVYTFGNAQLVKNTSWASTRRHKTPFHLVSPTAAEPIEARPGELMQPNEKFMFDTLAEKCLLSAENLFNVGHQICTKLQADQDAAIKNGTHIADSDDEPPVSVFDSVVHPDIPSQHVITCVGRIGCDAETKIGPMSTVLVSSDDAKLRTVRLNFSKMNSVGLFAGQTVAVRGINARGKELYVQEICGERQLTRPAIPTGLKEPLSVLVVSGPFTLTDDLTYEPLHDVMKYCKDNRPDVLIMMGPFVDANHGMIVDGVLTESYDVFFEKIVVMVMDSLGADTQVIIVSSSSDVNCPPVYPTHPMQIKRSFPNLRFVADPSIININGVTFAMTATDVISHLGEVELAHNAGEKIRRAVNYLFNQASFYPLNPSLDVNVDSELAGKFCALKLVPNVLLVPGDIKCYIRDINGCLVLNSGRLTDKKSRGTFARLVISPPAADETNLFNFMACQVIKV